MSDGGIELALKYSNNDSENSDSDSDSSLRAVQRSSTYLSATVDEYEDDKEVVSEASGIQEKSKDGRNSFRPLLNSNLFVINTIDNTLIIGLGNKERIYISGSFELQVIKGGIVYNNVHHNAAKCQYSVWHPLSESIPSIQSSYYGGWDEKVYTEPAFKDVMNNELKNHSCVIKIKNTKFPSLLDACSLYPDVNYLWCPRDSNQYYTSNQCSFHILDDRVDPFIPLSIPEKWTAEIDKLRIAHKNSQHDVRILVLGGKNSGKSTFLRLLLESLKYGDQTTDNNFEDVLYLDTDPGQPEYSDPECISLTQLTSNTKHLGQTLGLTYSDKLKQIYVGSPSPQDVFGKYIEAVDELLESFEEQMYMGTSLFNVPGWMKGLGLDIIDRIIQKYKPTHLVILETNTSKPAFVDLNIPETFNSEIRTKYQPVISRLLARSQHLYINENVIQNKFQASQIRTLKLLAHLHSIKKSHDDLRYNFKPLVNSSPLQVSFGNNGIKGIQFIDEFKRLHKDDIKFALEGTIVGLHMKSDFNTDSVSKVGCFPIVKKDLAKLDFVCLALIHSIDLNKLVMNIYIPEEKREIIEVNAENDWILVRVKTETPFKELYPDEQFEHIEAVPYVSKSKRKRHEHVWKVRKNVIRRGHQVK